MVERGRGVARGKRSHVLEDLQTNILDSTFGIFLRLSTKVRSTTGRL